MEFSKSQHLKRDIHDFTLEKNSLGRGQFGSVFKCIEKRNGKEFAIKLIEPTPNNDQDSYKRFTREVAIQSQAKHPAVLPLYCWGENCESMFGNVSFIMSPLMKNSSLDKYINQKSISQLSPTKRMIILYGTAVGMRFLHDNGIIHRDLKPGNILLDELYRPFVGDFGFSKYTPKNNEVSFSIRPGTPLYTAPELIEDDSPLSEKVDVYAYGIILFNILTGLQFSDKNAFQIARWVLDGNRPEIPKTVSEFYRDLINRCWHGSPFERPSFEEIVLELEEKKNLLEGANEGEFQKYKKYVNEIIPEKKVEQKEVKSSDEDSSSLPPPSLYSSFRGYPPTDLSRSQNFSKFAPFYFEFQGEDINISLQKNIIVRDAKSVISIEKMIPPSYLKLTYKGKDLDERGILSELAKCSPVNPINVVLVRDLEDLPEDEVDRECEVETEVHAQVNYRTTQLILKRGKRVGVEPIDIFHNFFVCGKNISLFSRCIRNL